MSEPESVLAQRNFHSGKWFIVVEDPNERLTMRITPQGRWMPAADSALFGEPREKPLTEEYFTPEQIKAYSTYLVSWPLVTIPAEQIAPGVYGYWSDGLLFRQAVIELLRSDEKFQVNTPFGRFRMTRAEFYDHFPEVVASDAYQSGECLFTGKHPPQLWRFRIA